MRVARAILVAALSLTAHARCGSADRVVEAWMTSDLDLTYRSTKLSPSGRGVTLVTESSLSLADVVDGTVLWTFTNHTRCSSPTFTADGSRLLAICSSDTRIRSIVSLDPASGKTHWVSSSIGKTTGSSSSYDAITLDAASRMGVVVVEETVAGFEVETGRVVWTADAADYSSPIFNLGGSGDPVAFVSNVKNTTLFSVQNGTALWTFSPPENYTNAYTSMGAISTNPSQNIAFVTVFGAGDSMIYAVDLHSRKTLWSYDPSDSAPGTPSADDTHMYVSGGSVSDETRRLSYNYLMAVDIASGSLDWEFKVQHMLISGAVSDGRSVVFNADFDGVFSLNASNGEVLWEYYTGVCVNSVSMSPSARTFVAAGCGAAGAFVVVPGAAVPRGKLIGVGVGIGILVAAVVGAGGLVLYKRKEKKKKSAAGGPLVDRS